MRIKYTSKSASLDWTKGIMFSCIQREFKGRLVQSVERRSTKPEAGGSSPPSITFFLDVEYSFVVGFFCRFFSPFLLVN